MFRKGHLEIEEKRRKQRDVEGMSVGYVTRGKAKENRIRKRIKEPLGAD